MSPPPTGGAEQRADPEHPLIGPVAVDRRGSKGASRIDTGACIAQEAYLCTGTHDFGDPRRPLQTAPIYIGPNAFIGARAFLLPGVSVEAGAIVGACSVVTRSVPTQAVVVGNPAQNIKANTSNR